MWVWMLPLLTPSPPPDALCSKLLTKQARPLRGGGGAGKGVAVDPSADGLVAVRGRDDEGRLWNRGRCYSDFGEVSGRVVRRR